MLRLQNLAKLDSVNFVPYICFNIHIYSNIAKTTFDIVRLSVLELNTLATIIIYTVIFLTFNYRSYRYIPHNTYIFVRLFLTSTTYGTEYYKFV